MRPHCNTSAINLKARKLLVWQEYEQGQKNTYFWRPNTSFISLKPPGEKLIFIAVVTFTIMALH